MNETTTQPADSLETACRLLYGESGTAVLVVNPANTRILYANPAFDALLKPGMLEEPRERLSDILKHGLQVEVREQMIDAIKEPEEPREGELVLREDLFLAETHPVRYAFRPIGDAECIEISFPGEAAIGATEESAGAADLQKRIAKLQKESAAKDLMYQRFAHLIGHELKAPLTALKGYTELLEYQFRDSGDGETLEILRMIVRSCVRLHASIDALYHTGEQDMLDRRYKTADLRKIFASVAAELEPARGNHALLFDETNARLKTNPVLLQELLYQILLFELLQAHNPDSSIRLRYRQVGDGYAFVVRHLPREEEEEEFPAAIDELIESLRPAKGEKRATTIGYAVAEKLIVQAGGGIALERGEEGMNAYYLLLPKIG